MWEQLWAFLSTSWSALLLCAVVAYLLGSINTAIIVTRLMGKRDIREMGSGNAGATNVLRSQGKAAALLTTLGDLLKSILAVLAGRLILRYLGGDAITPELLSLYGAYIAGFFCILGHLYPVFFGFRGGKGILATLGMMLMLDWKVALICLGIFIVVVLIWRMVSLGSVVAAFSMAVLTWVFRAFVYDQPPRVVALCTVMASIIALLLIYKHIPNLKRIAQGTERKLSFGHTKET